MNIIIISICLIVFIVILIFILKKFIFTSNQNIKSLNYSDENNFDLSYIKKTLYSLSSKQYQNIELLDSGGMGIILKGFDKERQRHIAIKTILPTLETDPEYIELFLKECQFIQAMNHPNVVRIFEVGRKDNFFYYVMDFMEGETVQDLIDKNEHLKIAPALKIGIQVTRGLMHIHSNGIIHRDIKPSNIFITYDKKIKIIDFGVSKLLEGKSNKNDAYAGSQTYAAPEQIQGEQITGKTDVYMLGISLYYMLTGQFPFPEGDLLAKIVGEPYPLKKFNQKISIPLQSIILSCIEKDPKQRISIHELWARLRTISG